MPVSLINGILFFLNNRSFLILIQLFLIGKYRWLDFDYRAKIITDVIELCDDKTNDLSWKSVDLNILAPYLETGTKPAVVRKILSSVSKSKPKTNIDFRSAFQYFCKWYRCFLAGAWKHLLHIDWIYSFQLITDSDNVFVDCSKCFADFILFCQK